MPDTFEDTLLDWIESNALFEGTDRVLLAVSGGADSVAMVYALHRLAQGGKVACGFVIGHVNHCLRGAESDADAAFVEQLGQSLGIQVVSHRVDVKQYAAGQKLSIETAGRVLRLKTLAQTAAQNNCGAVATAHHQDDLAETLVHRLMRGTGFRGLCGIRPASDVYGAAFVRPMLGVRRAEIVRYCNENAIRWREDASNENVDFTRNRIRHRLLPLLKDGASGAADIVGSLADLSQAARRLSAHAEEQACRILDETVVDHRGIALPQARLNACPPWVFYEVVRKSLMRLDVGLRHYTQEHFETLRGLTGQERAAVSMPGGVQVYANRGMLGFCRETMPPCLPSESVRLEVGQTAAFGRWRISSRRLHRDEVDVGRFLKTKDAFVEWFDADRISGRFEIRRRKDGDRFWPIGGQGEKKVARFLMDAQMDETLKKRAFIIADCRGILWAAPVRMSERGKITEETQRIIEVRVSDSSSNR